LITMNTSKTMKTSGPRFIFFGTEDFSATSLEALLEYGYDIRAVVTKPDTKKGRGHKRSAPLVKTIAAEHNIPVWQPERLSEITEDIKKLQPVTGVLVSYGRIIPKATINLFTPGIINLHPSLLPKYRGPSPIESAIANGDRSTGVSIMQLTHEMDAGPVYHKVKFHLPQYETGPHLTKKLARTGASELVASIGEILDGSLKAKPQDDLKATYCHLLTRADGDLHPTKQTAQQAERLIRAYLDFPRTRFDYKGTSLIVTKAHVAKKPKTPLDAAYKDGNFLVIDELVAPSGKTMSADAYLKGRKS